MTLRERLNKRAGQPLTDDELATITLLAQGLERDEIASSLWCSVDAVKSRMRSIRAKLGARNGAHVVAIAYQRGLLRPPAAALPEQCSACQGIRKGETT